MTISHVYGVVCDLVFGSQIQEAVIASGLSYRAFRSSADALAQLSSDQPAQEQVLWVVNLAAKSNSEPEIVEAVLPPLLTSACTVVCYAPHVEEARMEWASGIGAQHVVPRGSLIRTMGELLS